MEFFASLAHKLRTTVGGAIERPPDSEQLHMQVIDLQEGQENRPDSLVVDDLTREYFRRWTKSVERQTDLLIDSHQRKERLRRIKDSNAACGIMLLMDEKLILDMETRVGAKAFNDSNSVRIEEEWISLPKISNIDWESMLSQPGLRQRNQVLERIFYGGICGDARRQIWPFLTGIYDWESSSNEREETGKTLRADYMQLLSRWKKILLTDQPSPIQTLICESENKVKKDVVRTDRENSFFAKKITGIDDSPKDMDHGSAMYIERELVTYPHLAILSDILVTYSTFQIEVGYVQGMNDLASPLLEMMENDWLTFWTFVKIMDPERNLREKNNFWDNSLSLLANFHENQVGMRTRMILLTYMLRLLMPKFYRALEDMDCPLSPSFNDKYFSIESSSFLGGATSLIWLFRGLLLLWKRELVCKSEPQFVNVARLWEAYLSGRQLWTPFMDIWIALAIIDGCIKYEVESGKISSFEELLKKMNTLRLDSANSVAVILKDCRRMMKEFQRISKEFAISCGQSVLKSKKYCYWEIDNNDPLLEKEKSSEQKLWITFEDAIKLLSFR